MKISCLILALTLSSQISAEPDHVDNAVRGNNKADRYKYNNWGFQNKYIYHNRRTTLIKKTTIKQRTKTTQGDGGAPTITTEDTTEIVTTTSVIPETTEVIKEFTSIASNVGSPQVSSDTGVESVAEIAESTTVEVESAATTNPESSNHEVSNSGVDVDFANEMIANHNEKRVTHHSPNLSWDTTMYNFAKDYAQQFDCSSDGFVHSGGPYGENLWISGGVSNSPAQMASEAANSWYSEVDGYDWNTQSEYNHFTAMIWKSTAKFGCAFKDCSGANTGWDNYVICSYGDQVPNMLGGARENVLRP